MSTEFQCPAAGCGKDAAVLAPDHDPFAEDGFEQLSGVLMTPSCHEHADTLWNLYRNRAVLSLLNSSSDRPPVSMEAIGNVARILNSHNHPLSKSVAALLAAVGPAGPS